MKRLRILRRWFARKFGYARLACLALLIGFAALRIADSAVIAVGTGGTLAISDGAHTVDLALLGHYSADDFSIVPDHAKGTLVTFVSHDLVV
jgi:hypothetical protein